MPPFFTARQKEIRLWLSSIPGSRISSAGIGEQVTIHAVEYVFDEPKLFEAEGWPGIVNRLKTLQPLPKSLSQRLARAEPSAYLELLGALKTACDTHQDSSDESPSPFEEEESDDASDEENECALRQVLDREMSLVIERVRERLGQEYSKALSLCLDDRSERSLILSELTAHVLLAEGSPSARAAVRPVPNTQNHFELLGTQRGKKMTAGHAAANVRRAFEALHASPRILKVARSELAAASTIRFNQGDRAALIKVFRAVSLALPQPRRQRPKLKLDEEKKPLDPPPLTFNEIVRNRKKNTKTTQAIIDRRRLPPGPPPPAKKISIEPPPPESPPPPPPPPPPKKAAPPPQQKPNIIQPPPKSPPPPPPPKHRRVPPLKRPDMRPKPKPQYTNYLYELRDRQQDEETESVASSLNSDRSSQDTFLPANEFELRGWLASLGLSVPSSTGPPLRDPVRNGSLLCDIVLRALCLKPSTLQNRELFRRALSGTTPPTNSAAAQDRIRAALAEAQLSIRSTPLLSGEPRSAFWSAVETIRARQLSMQIIPIQFKSSRRPWRLPYSSTDRNNLAEALVRWLHSLGFDEKSKNLYDLDFTDGITLYEISLKVTRGKQSISPPQKAPEVITKALTLLRQWRPPLSWRHRSPMTEHGCLRNDWGVLLPLLEDIRRCADDLLPRAAQPRAASKRIPHYEEKDGEEIDLTTGDARWPYLSSLRPAKQQDTVRLSSTTAFLHVKNESPENIETFTVSKKPSSSAQIPPHTAVILQPESESTGHDTRPPQVFTSSTLAAAPFRKVHFLATAPAVTKATDASIPPECMHHQPAVTEKKDADRKSSIGPSHPHLDRILSVPRAAVSNVLKKEKETKLSSSHLESASLSALTKVAAEIGTDVSYAIKKKAQSRPAIAPAGNKRDKTPSFTSSRLEAADVTIVTERDNEQNIDSYLQPAERPSQIGDIAAVSSLKTEASIHLSRLESTAVPPDSKTEANADKKSEHSLDGMMSVQPAAAPVVTTIESKAGRNTSPCASIAVALCTKKKDVKPSTGSGMQPEGILGEAAVVSTIMKKGTKSNNISSHLDSTVPSKPMPSQSVTNSTVPVKEVLSCPTEQEADNREHCKDNRNEPADDPHARALSALIPRWRAKLLDTHKTRKEHRPVWWLDEDEDRLNDPRLDSYIENDLRDTPLLTFESRGSAIARVDALINRLRQDCSMTQRHDDSI